MFRCQLITPVPHQITAQNFVYVTQNIVYLYVETNKIYFIDNIAIRLNHWNLEIEGLMQPEVVFWDVSI